MVSDVALKLNIFGVKAMELQRAFNLVGGQRQTIPVNIVYRSVEGRGKIEVEFDLDEREVKRG